MKYRVIPIAIVLTLVTGNGFAEDQDGVVAATVLQANRAEISLLDILAAGRDLLIKPSRVIDYWPEYRYSYSEVVDTFYEGSTNGDSPCAIANIDPDTGDFDLGTVAVFWQEPNIQEQDINSDAQPLNGWPIVTVDNAGILEDTPWSVNDNRWSLDLREFCRELETIESVVSSVGINNTSDPDDTNATHLYENSVLQQLPSGIDRQNLYFVTSQALPDQNLEFERVRIQPFSQNLSTN